MEKSGKEVPPPTDKEKDNPPVVPKKKRKQEPEVTIAPSTPGGPDISVD